MIRSRVRLRLLGLPQVTLDERAPKAMAAEGQALAGRQYGEYAQSSGSGNVVMALATPDTMAKLPAWPNF